MDNIGLDTHRALRIACKLLSLEETADFLPLAKTLWTVLRNINITLSESRFERHKVYLAKSCYLGFCTISIDVILSSRHKILQPWWIRYVSKSRETR